MKATTENKPGHRPPQVAIRVHQLSKVIGEYRLLSNISFSILAGEFVGVLGPSGSGKSTLLKLLLGIQKASDGSVYLGTGVGYVPQDDIVHPLLTPQEALEFAARLRLAEIGAYEIEYRTYQLLQDLGLSERAHTLIAKLSGGQRKRVNIGVELVTSPQGLLLDEPTSGLDPATECEIMQYLAQLARAGRTVLVTTHILENAGILDRLLILVRGRLVFDGSVGQAREYFQVQRLTRLYHILQKHPSHYWAKRFQDWRATTLKVPGICSQALCTSSDQGSNGQATFQHCRTVHHASPPAPNQTARARRLQAQSQDQSSGSHGPSTAQELGAKVYRMPAASRARNAAPVPSRDTPLSSYHSLPANNSHQPASVVIQAATLTWRYTLITLRDLKFVSILIAQAPLIALFIVLAYEGDQQIGQVHIIFKLSLAAIWFGCINSCREIVKERTILDRELMAGLSPLAYLLSKIVLLCVISLVQILLLAGLVLPVEDMPGDFIVVTGLLLLTTVCGLGLGLLISACVRNSDRALTALPILLMPQVIFVGIFSPLQGIARYAEDLMISKWSYEALSGELWRGGAATKPVVILACLALFFFTMTYLALQKGR